MGWANTAAGALQSGGQADVGPGKTQGFIVVTFKPSHLLIFPHHLIIMTKAKF